MIEKNLKLKIELMTNGVNISSDALEYLIQEVGQKFYNDDYVTTSGVMIEFEDLFVTSHINKESKYKICLNENNDFYLQVENKRFPIKFWEPSEFMVKGFENKFGPITNFVNAHFDRARISPISGCNNHCAFCSMNEIKYKKNSIEAMDLALKEALKDKRITHVLISGGSPKSEDLEYLTSVYEYFCKNYPNYDFDVMMTPRGFDSYTESSQYESYIKHLKKIGVKGLSINLELFNDKICAKYCREKFEIGKQNYFKFLKLASKIFGTENVRSGLIVGLEKIEDTLCAVEEICKCHCMPMLSPYIPYKNIGDYPSNEYLCDVLEKALEIMDKYNIPLAPLCSKCRHNTL